ncbi:MAG: hypothetical protein ACREJU_04125, partial [Nitrospiraceae bacterium]
MKVPHRPIITSSVVLFLTLLPLILWAAEQEPETPTVTLPEVSVAAAPAFNWRDWIEKSGAGGHARFDYYTASKRLDGNHSLPGLTLQPKAMP